ncbi:1-acylglycerol-3-phosphate O-acyltransferase SLC1 [Ascoidea rubescens DSM 1968]|uniref:1-acyl-sn-glycerol-3-phosphate acyltransferase n=1 Tax=Ascoidea rubescens DSM 1968 TaxID=1344418 RepID=A0A1D2VLE9_9ASCO|nr:1-acyl-sn-gylcerol-3-phosphate acyltransferase [Ascoidea rubescens DSM 1968]ODV62404.1 1-acyl-sn-gylcerol-3-phosphate acyltransferase [Ascoidea rubescens DSM 1968]
MSFQTIKFYLKGFLATNIFFLSAAYGVFASSFLFLIGKSHLSQYTTARFFYYLFSKVLGIDIVVRNEQMLTQNLPGILVCNHQSTLDILVLGKVLPKGCTVTAKKSLKYIPFLGWFMVLSGTFFLDRKNKDKSINTLNNAVKNLESKKRSLWLFPEGTRSYSNTPTLLPFKKGAFHLAVDSQLPIFPVSVSNTSNILNFKKKIFKKGTVYIDILDPIPTKGLTKSDVTNLCEESRNKMFEDIKHLGYSKTKGSNETNNSDLNNQIPPNESISADNSPSSSSSSTSLKVNATEVTPLIRNQRIW